MWLLVRCNTHFVHHSTGNGFASVRMRLLNFDCAALYVRSRLPAAIANPTAKTMDARMDSTVTTGHDSMKATICCILRT